MLFNYEVLTYTKNALVFIKHSLNTLRLYFWYSKIDVHVQIDVQINRKTSFYPAALKVLGVLLSPKRASIDVGQLP